MSRLRLVISNSARADLTDIWAYIAEDSLGDADGFVDMLREKCEMLADSPELGRRRDDLTPGLRSFPVRRYQIFYRIAEREIQIVRVLSGYRDLDQLF